MASSRMLALTVGAMLLASCATMSVVSPDGKSSVSYRGTSIIGAEEISCGTMAGITTCSASGQNVAGLAQAIAPYVAQAYGIPLPPAPPAPTATATTGVTR